MSAWLLPDHIADVLPSEARHIEELRRRLLDTACTYGYELVIPPLIEHLDSLLTGTGQALELQTFKLVDQLSGRSLGLRADTTPQVARIDAHLLGRQAITRLCYCGPVLHTRPERPHATREPLQFGAEIYGHAGREADVEILSLALDCLRAAPLNGLSVDLADARIVRALLAGVMAAPTVLAEVHHALAAKDASTLARLTRDFPAASRDGLQALVGLYGDEEVLIEALDSSQETRDAYAELMASPAAEKLRQQLAEREAEAEGAANINEIEGLEAQLLGIEDQGDVYLASVEFSGMSREEQGAGLSPFREVWNMAKPKSGNGGWLVAGLQALT